MPPKGDEASAARFCSVRSDGSVSWDADKLLSSLDPAELEDGLFLRNVVRGTIVTGGLFPLVFDDSEHPIARLRSLGFFREMAADPAKYESLDEDRKLTVSIGVRDLFFADSRGLLDDDERELFRRVVDVVDVGPLGRLNGMGFGFCPTRSAKCVRFMPELQGIEHPELADLFARVDSGGSKFYAVFVDAEELSYHNFENILPLDRALCAGTEEMSLGLSDPCQVDRGLRLYRMRLRGASLPMLEQLRDMDSLYVTPSNSGARGGRRFIFQSAALGRALTAAFESSGLLSENEDRGDDGQFVAVNPVFRCNRFEPHDAKFASHRDTPYFDPANLHVSRYTVLLYLTGGTGHPALRVEGLKLNELAGMSCVVFDQSYEHEGRAFEDGTKVFLRTELIFQVPPGKLEPCPRAAALFSSACYMTGQSALHPELSRHAHDCYERVNSLRWGQPMAPKDPPTFVLRSMLCGPPRFMTNGYDYWFPRSAGSLAHCALVAVLDHFNCVIPGAGAFRKFCSSVVRRGTGDPAWVWAQLTEEREDDAGIGNSEQSDIEVVMGHRGAQLERRMTRSMTGRAKKAQGEVGCNLRATDATEKVWLFESLLGAVPRRKEGQRSHCCPFHNFRFTSWRCDEVVDVFEKCRDWSRRCIAAAPVIFLGHEVLIDESCVLVEGDKIYVRESRGKTSGEASGATKFDGSERINFAACWNDESRPPCYVDVKDSVAAPRLLLPPICFVESEEGYRLMLDFFKNDWMMTLDATRNIPVPKYLRDYSDIDIDKAPFCKAANPKYDLETHFGWGDDFRLEADEADE